MLGNDEGRSLPGAAPKMSDDDVAILPLTGCVCGHLYDEDCIRHLPVEGTGARYKAARRVA